MNTQLSEATPMPLNIRERIATFDRAMTADELAAILGVSEITVYKHAKAGRIPSFRIGTCVRFCPQTVAEWIAKQ
ncbi:MAG TPA: helix-turn-helix domain-containing protein [Acidobacteriaceae bacterium]|jgi:excisionase family DNA binding protein